jgi:hypothetical protein
MLALAVEVAVAGDGHRLLTGRRCSRRLPMRRADGARVGPTPANGYVRRCARRCPSMHLQRLVGRHGASGEHVAAGAALPPPYRGAPVLSLWLSFGAEDTLTSVVVVRRSPHAATISATCEAITAALAGQAGPSAELLAARLLRQASAEYRFRDYYAPRVKLTPDLHGP